MDLVLLKKQIQQNKLEHFYIFCGPEIGLQNMYINQMSNNMPARADNIKDIWNKLTGKNKLFKTNRKFVYVVRDDEHFMSNEKYWNNVNNIVSGTLVLLITDLDKRSKFYKHFKDIIIPFNHLTTVQLLPTVKKLIKGTDKDLKYFIEACDNDYNTIINELDKLKYLGYDTITKQITDTLRPPAQESNVFKMTDYLINKNSKKTLTELQSLLDNGGNEVGILSVIATKLEQCILVEGYRDEKNIASITGLNGWTVKAILNNNRLAPSSLLTGLRIVQKFDSSIKNGLLEPDMAVTNCVIEILNLP